MSDYEIFEYICGVIIEKINNMYIASQKRKENIAEYLLYMWQIEDLIRANGLDLDKITENIIDKYDLSPDQRKELKEWYESLIDMMRRENVVKSGHLQLNKNIIIQLNELHHELLKSPKYPNYSAEFYNTLPYIVELRAKQGDDKLGEIETCFTALYGTLLMRLQGKEISDETRKAIAQISRFIATLSHYYQLEQEDKLWNDD